MVDQGLLAAGFDTIVIDGGWSGGNLDGYGRAVPSRGMWPSAADGALKPAESGGRRRDAMLACLAHFSSLLTCARAALLLSSRQGAELQEAGPVHAPARAEARGLAHPRRAPAGR